MEERNGKGGRGAEETSLWRQEQWRREREKGKESKRGGGWGPPFMRGHSTYAVEDVAGDIRTLSRLEYCVNIGKLILPGDRPA